ncbi:dephospho-CoA kinase [Pseudonocardiaceae bacterium YIM PH 21723]|nr:dephospho-CoA kinase [Pseudonocardiaceae bacterium YIM PH 21723]
MLRVGLTGGIGSGKSTVAARLSELGAVVIDADQIAREVVAPGTEGLSEVVATFGADVLRADGSMDRAAVAARVFGDAEALAKLNAIVHPRVGMRTAELMSAAPPDAVVVYDVPLLVEKDMAPAFHLAIVVDAPEEIRVRRLTTIRGMAEKDARARIAAQATVEQRRAVADAWLDNSGSTEGLQYLVDELWKNRLLPFETNLREGQGSSGAPVIHEYDPEWPAAAQRLITRIVLAVGEFRVDHIGSTSVPGLAAKDRIDLQLTVPSMDAAAELAGPLAEIGFPLVPHITRDLGRSTAPDADLWRKQLHIGADPGRHANLHIRVESGNGWRYALLFRDWLRANPEERAAYEAVKRELAERFAGDADSTRYAEAKEPWFDAATERMEIWALKSGWAP